MDVRERNVFLGVILVLLVIVAVFSVSVTRKKVDPFDPPGGGGGSVIPRDRVMEKIEVPGAKCGDGSQYVMFFSEGPESVNGKPNNRVVIWMPGGGSTQTDRETGEVSSPIKDAASFLDRLTPPGDYYLTQEYMETRDFIFLNHPDNADFVEDAHWAIFPYCTQDFHSGNRDDFVEYDFTGVSGLERDIEKVINDDIRTLQEIEQRFPNLDIEGRETNSGFEVDSIKISILHTGSKNFDLSSDLLFEIFKDRGFDIKNSEVVLAGSSAGGFGTWYNGWKIGDVLYEYSGAKFTMVPQAGSPTLRSWNGEDLEFEQEQLLDMNHRLGWHGILLPCEVSGAGHNGAGECKDALDLLDHYNDRYEGSDFRLLAVINKEDLLAVRGLGFDSENDPGFDEALLTLCQSVHRYAQYFYLTDNTDVYAAWLYNKKGNGFTRVHGFKNAALTVEMQKPDGQNSGGKTLMKLINEVALRDVSGPPQIEHVLGVVQDPDAFESKVIAQPDHIPECNVPWPGEDRP